MRRRATRGRATDQVIVRMFGLEHSRHVLQVVRVDLLRTSPGEGHGDDALGDVRQVEFIPLLHPESGGPVESRGVETRAAQNLRLLHTIPSLSECLCSSQYLMVKVLRFSHCVRVSCRYLYLENDLNSRLYDRGFLVCTVTANLRNSVCVGNTVIVETKH